MKKRFYIILVLLFVCLVSGCDNNSKHKDTIKKEETTNTTKNEDTNTIKKEEKSNCSINNNNGKYDFAINESLVCPEIKNIAYSGDGYFIDNQGILYEISNKLYSTTNTNCRKVETDVIFEKAIKNTLISKDGSFYTYWDSKLKKVTNEEIENGRAWYGINQMEIKLYRLNKNISYIAQLDMNDPEIYVFTKGNEIYQVTYDYNTNKASEKLIYTFNDGEKVVSLTDGYVITNKNYYRYGEINKNECSKYEDVKCEYGLVVVDSISNCSSEIIYISNSRIVTKNMIK